MKPQALVLLLLLAALGSIAFFLLRGRDEVAPADLPGASPQAADARGATGEPVSAGGAAGSEAALDASAESVNRTAAPDTTPTPSKSPGTTLRGRLVDLDGNPRAQVLLSVDTFPDYGGTIDLASEPVRGGESRQRVTTRDDGSFEAQVAIGREGTFSLPDSDLVFVERQLFKGVEGDQDLGDLVVARAASLSGIVQDENGQPVANVKVEAQLGGIGLGAQSITTSGDDGTFSVGKLRPGKWLLRTVSNRFLPATEEHELEAEQQRRDVVLVLARGRAVSGRVVDDRGVGVAGMKVTSRRREAHGGVDIQRFSGDEAAVTDDVGNFTLSGLEGETVALRAYGPGHATVTVQNIKTDGANVEIRVERLATIAGVLVAADGTPISGSRISATTDAGNVRPIQAVQEAVDIDIPGLGPSTTTDEQGKFMLESVKPGLVMLKARGKTHLPVEHGAGRVEPGTAMQGVRMVAEAGAIARVKVVDGDGSAIAGAKVEIRKAPKPSTPGMRFNVRASSDEELPEGFDFGRRNLGAATSDEQGIATILGLPAGDAIVNATHEQFAPSEKGRLSLPKTGRIEHQVVMREPSFVDVVVTNTDGSAAAGTEVVLELPKGAERQASAEPRIPGFGDDNQEVDKKRADAEGKVRFGPIGAGNYRAVLSRGARGQGVGNMMVFVGNQSDKIASSAKPVSVLEGKTARIELQYPILTRLTGRVMGSQGPVAGCAVELSSVEEDTGVSGLGGRQEKADLDGNFVFEGVESGDYVLRYGKASQIVKASAELQIAANTPELHRELTLRTGTVRVQVLTKDDAEPVERAEVRLTRGGDAPSAGRQPQRVMMIGISTSGEGGDETSTVTFGDERVLTDDDGIAVFEDVPVGDYTLKVSSRKHAPGQKDDVSVVELQVTDCGILELAGAGQIRGVVTNGQGKQVMAMVEKRLVGTDEWGRGEMAMRGSYRLRGLAPGQYELRARAVGPGGGEPGEPVVAEVKVGKTKVVNLTVE